MGGSPKRRQKNAKPSRPKASSTLTKVSPVSATTTDTMAPSDASAPASKPAALSPPEPPAHRRAHRQFARLLGAVLDEFGINGPIAQSKALGLKHHQTIQQLFDSREEKEKSLSEENYVRVESAVRQLIRDRGAQRTKGHTRGAIAVSISGTCRPLAMLGKLRQLFNRSNGKCHGHDYRVPRWRPMIGDELPWLRISQNGRDSLRRRRHF